MCLARITNSAINYAIIRVSRGITHFDALGDANLARAYTALSLSLGKDVSSAEFSDPRERDGVVYVDICFRA